MDSPETLPSNFDFNSENVPATLPPDFVFNGDQVSTNIEQPKVQERGAGLPMGNFFDTVLNAPASLLTGIIGHGAEWTGQGLEALGFDNIGTKLQKGARKTLEEGIPGLGSGMYGQQPKNIWDVAGKTAETGADVLAVINPAAAGWQIPGLFALSSGLESKAAGEGALTAVEKGAGAGLLTYFGGKLLGGIAEVAASGISKILSSTAGKFISQSMGNFVNKIAEIGKTNPSLLANPDVISEANVVYDNLQKDLWKTIIKEGKVAGVEEKVQNQAIDSASKELTKAFNSKDLTYARMFQRDDVAMPNVVDDLKGTLNVFKNAEAQFGQTGASDLIAISKGSAPIKGLADVPTGMWEQYLKAVSPILTDEGMPRIGVSLADFLKAELRSKSMGLSDSVQTMVDKTFKQYESDAMNFVKARGTDQEKTIFNELGQRVDKAEYKYVENVVKSKLTDSFNMYENPSKFFGDIVDTLSGKGVTQEQVSKFKSLFDENSQIMQDGLFNRLIEKMGENVEKGAYKANAKMIDSVLENGGELFNSSQRNALRYGYKPIASQDFREFMGNFTTGKSGKISPEIVSATQEVATAQKIASTLQKALQTEDPEILYSGFKSLTPNELETVRVKLPAEGKIELDTFLKVNALNEIKDPIKNNLTGKYDVSGIERLVNKLQDVRTGLSLESQEKLDAMSKILQTQSNLEDITTSRLETILRGLKNLTVSKFAGGLGRYSAITDIAKGIFGEYEKVTVPQYISIVKEMVNQGKIINGTDLISPKSIAGSGTEKALLFSSQLLNLLSRSLSQMMSGHISEGVISPSDYINRASNLMGREPTEDEQKALMDQYNANQQ